MTTLGHDAGCMRRRHPTSIALTALAGLLLALPVVGGCSSQADDAEAEGPAPVSFAPVEFGTGMQGAQNRDEFQQKRKLDPRDAGWQEKYELAQRYAAGGYDEAALQVLDGAIAQAPPAPWGDRLRGLRQSLIIQRAEEVLLRVEARGMKDYVPFETPVDFVVRLRNVSDTVVSFHAPKAGANDVSASAVMLEMRRRDRDVHATQLTRSWNMTLYLQKPGDPPIRIEPGEVHEMPARIPADAAGPAIAGVRTLELTGTLRPSDLRKGGEPRLLTLPIRPGRVMALPRGFEPLAADPLRSMRTAIDTVAPAHLLVAAEFVPPSRRPEAMALLGEALGAGHPALYRAALGSVDLLRERAVGTPVGPLAGPLVQQLEVTPGRADALMEALSTLTGVRLAPDARLWTDWYRREANRRQPVTAPGSP